MPGTTFAGELRARGHDVIVPSLLGVGAGDPPYWPRVVDAVLGGLAGTAPERPLVLVAHSNAGLLMPMIRAALANPIAGSVFVDAALPALGEQTPVVPDEYLAVLRGKVDAAGLLPRWTDWFDDEDVEPMFPDPATRRTVTEEQPRLPLAYYETSVPVAPGWDDHPCAYVLFGPPYEELAAAAGEGGWPVLTVPGQHLHQLVDPAAVTTAIVTATSQ
jgi:pimeloyl-ACP methyl ester carboxylesterase